MELNELFTALAKAQSEFLVPIKNCTAQAGQGKYRYADLASIVEATRPVLNKNGLSILQLIGGTREAPNLTTVLGHASGASIEAHTPIFLDQRGSASQVLGSGVTYARRYAWAAICGIVAEDDDDGNDGKAQTQQGDTKMKPPPASSNKPQFAYVPSAGHPCSAIQNAIKAKANDGKVQLLPIMEKLTKDLGLEPREYREEHPKLVEYFSKIDAAVMAQEPK